MERTRLFVDMDGTLATFYPVEKLEILYEEGYFRNLAPIQNVVDAVKEIILEDPEIEVHILSAYLTDSPYALKEKNEWLDEHLPELEKENRIFLPCGEDKKQVIPGGARENDFLLDDYTNNLMLWQPPGKGIKLLNGINHTKGTWQHDALRYDKDAVVLAKNIVEVLNGEQIRDATLKVEDIQLSEKQAEYFRNSKVRDQDGNLLTLYHGTGTSIEKFEPHYTGNGIDQYGSGFYFTTDYDTAKAYTEYREADERTGKEVRKLGGEDEPQVIHAYIDLRNPIILNAMEETNLQSIVTTQEETKKIMEYLPSLHILQQEDINGENPLGDFFPEYEEGKLSVKEQGKLIERLTTEFYQNSDLNQLDTLFRKYPTEFRTAIHEVLNYDGVIADFGDSKHVIAWFLEQIKDVKNIEPSNTAYLVEPVPKGTILKI
jgi:Uncharacterized protein conserved in bacteria